MQLLVIITIGEEQENVCEIVMEDCYYRQSPNTLIEEIHPSLTIDSNRH